MTQLRLYNASTSIDLVPSDSIVDGSARVQASATTEPDVAGNPIIILKENSGSDASWAQANKILLAKYKTVYSKIDIFSSAASLEAQLDVLTKIVLDIVKTNPDLTTKYQSDLDKILTSSVETLGPVDINELVSDKLSIRQKQIDYFTLRNNAGSLILPEKN